MADYIPPSNPVRRLRAHANALRHGVLVKEDVAELADMLADLYQHVLSLDAVVEQMIEPEKPGAKGPDGARGPDGVVVPEIICRKCGHPVTAGQWRFGPISDGWEHLEGECPR